MKKKFLFLAIAIPILAQTNITQINQSKALFISQGELILTNSYSHLIVNFDLNILQNDLESLRKMQHSLQLITPTSDWPYPNSTKTRTQRLQRRVAFIQSYVNNTVNDLTAKIKAVLYSLGHEVLLASDHEIHQAVMTEFKGQLPQSHRGKRQVVAGTLGLIIGAGAGFISRLFTQSSLEDILEEKTEILAEKVSQTAIMALQNERDIKKLQRTTSSLFKALQKMAQEQSYLQMDSQMLFCLEVSTIIHRRLSETVETLHAARAGQLNLIAINARSLQLSLKQLSRQAMDQGYKLTTTSIEDLSTLETSTVVRNHTIAVIVHLPVYRPGERLELYNYLSTPLRASHHPNAIEGNLDTPVYINIKAVEPFLGITTDRTLYTTLSAENLSACRSRGSTHYCPHLTKMKSAAPSCTHALFRANEVLIARSCQTEFITHHNTVRRLAANSWLITTSQPQSMEVTCPDAPLEKHILEGSLIVTLPSGCVANTAYFSIEKPQFESDVTFENTIIQELPEINLHSLLPVNDTTFIRDQLASIGKPLTPGELQQATSFQQELHRLNGQLHPFSFRNLFHTSITALLSLLLLSFGSVTVYYIYHRCRPNIRIWRPRGAAMEEPPAAFHVIHPEPDEEDQEEAPAVEEEPLAAAAIIAPVNPPGPAPRFHLPPLQPVPLINIPQRNN